MQNDQLKAVAPSDKQIAAGEIELDLKKRLELIDKEFKEGLTFISKFSKSVTVFGSSVLKESDPYYVKARNLGKLVSQNGYTIVTGGGPGIMEAANRGAIDAGGMSIGLNITLPQEQKQNGYVTASHEFYYFFSRKMALTFAAEAYVYFPGGFGTFNEFFEIATLIQTRRMAPAPMILVGKEFWKPMDELIKKGLLERGLVQDSVLNIYTILDDEKEIMDTILKAPLIDTVPFPS